jgi:hypothetical protein
MPGISQDQIASAVRWAITAASGVVSGYLISKGWASTGSAAALTTFLIGLVPSIATFIWGLWAHSTSSTIAAASALPEVHKIVTTSAIATSTQFAPNDKIVSQ